MCGIIGYLTQEDNSQDVILQSLYKLEYRGYDSAGICLICEGEFYVRKSLGEIKNLDKLLTEKKKSSCGVGHTRWATHGEVSFNNTHPHFSQDNKWCVVHNGIIENYLELKKQLEQVSFYGQTDTEVIPNLMMTNINTNDILKFKETIQKLQGSFAICCMNKSTPNTLYLARRNCPLFVAINKNTVMASSDPVCFEDYETYYEIPNDTFAVATLDGISFYDENCKFITPIIHEMGVFEKSAQKGDYPYFAEKEINETKNVLKNIITSYATTPYLQNVNLDNITKIKLIGCGTAFHACLMGARYIEEKTKKEANAYIASEFICQNPIIDNHTLCIFASQSGETADTLLALKLAKQKGAKTIALVNVPYSSIAKNADVVLPLCAGMEIAVISTKAYNAMLYVFYMLACKLANKPCNINLLENSDFFKIKDDATKFSHEILNYEKIFFIGKNEDYITAKEAALKLKEITYINCVSIPSGELKHGTLALIDDKSLVFVIATKKQLLSKNLSSASEIKSRGGKIVLVTNLNLTPEQKKDVDFVVNFDYCDQELSSMISITFFQFLAYKTCLNLGKNPDKPRNLAKSVTVE